ncbi:hypothetical protein Vi05172_g2132 [Venturia inaequalis]|nr:hypothetical protein Vi05172_g2132 [Venturia inaequalis]
MTSSSSAPSFLTLPAEIRTQILYDIFDISPADLASDALPWQPWYEQRELILPLRLTCKQMFIDVMHAEKAWKREFRKNLIAQIFDLAWSPVS